MVGLTEEEIKRDHGKCIASSVFRDQHKHATEIQRNSASVASVLTTVLLICLL